MAAGTSPSPNGLPPEIINQAATWAALLDAGDMDAADREALERWCEADPLHRRTLERMLSFDSRLKDASTSEREAVRTFAGRLQANRLGVGGSLLAITGLMLLGWVGLQGNFVRDFFPDQQTLRGEQRTVALVDGSSLTLDTDAAVRLDFAESRRTVRLVRGQVLAEVAKDTSRPFTVETQDGSATALGTAFTVKREAERTIVTVIQSTVRACPPQADQVKHCQTLKAGQRAAIDGQQVVRLADIDPAGGALWATGWLEVSDREVGEILAELARYRTLPIRFDRNDLKGLRVTGSFPLRTPDRALEGIGRIAPVAIQHLPDGSVSVTRR